MKRKNLIPQTSGTIYALSDPRNPNLPRYIGKTQTPLRVRLRRHFGHAKRRPHLELSKWITSLRDAGIRPNIYVVEAVVDGDLRERETAWIQFFKPLGILNRSNGDGMLGMKQASGQPIISKDGRWMFGSILDGARAMGVDFSSLRAAVITPGRKCRGTEWRYCVFDPNHLNPETDDLPSKFTVERRCFLTPIQREKIKALHASKSANQTEIANQFGCDQSTVSRLVNNDTRKRV